MVQLCLESEGIVVLWGYDSPVGYGEEYFSKNISVSQTCKLKGVATFYLLPSTKFG